MKTSARRFSGWDSGSFRGNAVLVVLAAAFLLALTPDYRLRVAVLGGLVLLATVAVRYELTISARGITLVRSRLILFCTRQTWMLHADVDTHQSWEADEPDGLCVRSSPLNCTSSGRRAAGQSGTRG